MQVPRYSPRTVLKALRGMQERLQQLQPELQLVQVLLAQVQAIMAWYYRIAVVQRAQMRLQNLPAAMRHDQAVLARVAGQLVVMLKLWRRR